MSSCAPREPRRRIETYRSAGASAPAPPSPPPIAYERYREERHNPHPWVQGRIPADLELRVGGLRGACRWLDVEGKVPGMQAGIDVLILHAVGGRVLFQHQVHGFRTCRHRNRTR